MYEGMHSAQFMGLINAVRTGDPTVDMVAAFLLPFIVQKAMAHVPNQIKRLVRYILGKKKIPVRLYKRNIIHRTTQNSNGGVVAGDADSFNMYLLRAIQFYVNRHCPLKELDDGHLDLTLLDTTGCTQNGNGRVSRYDRHGSQVNNSTVDMLQSCSLVEKPLENVWLDVGTHGGGDVQIMICDSVVQNNKQQQGDSGQDQEGGGDGDKGKSTRSLEIKLQSETSVDCLHAFTDNALEWYIEEMRKAENKDRYMLDVQPMGFRDNSVPQYVAYKLGDEKTFDTLFNRKCKELLRVVDHFENKTGKYAIKGYPYKLGLLLTGVPGTGKTSLIKALAHRTGRHIVNIDLAHIDSNRNLRKIFFNKMYQINGATSHQMRLDFDQVMFVLEDVDAGAKEVVMDRELLAEMQADQPKVVIEEKKEEGPLRAAGLRGRNHMGSTAVGGSDRLNLSGLLNVLDGVVETPGRMVIMTTNHPEILDPALIRPGRIDKVLELGHMDDPDDICAMTEHYYPKRSLTEPERTKIAKCIVEDGIKITPAQVEQLAMESEELAEFLGSLCCYGTGEVKKPKARIPANFVIKSVSTEATENSSALLDPLSELEEMLLEIELGEYELNGGDY